MDWTRLQRKCEKNQPQALAVKSEALQPLTLELIPALRRAKVISLSAESFLERRSRGDKSTANGVFF
jgi:hypothetical protein